MPDFEVSTWQEPIGYDPFSVPFFDRQDGTFTLEDVGQGSVGIVARVSDQASSGVRILEVGTEPVNVDLEVQPSILGSGTVIDAASGRPLSDATLQPFHVAMGNPTVPTLHPVPIGPDGRFDLAIFGPGRSRTLFSAPGYSKRWVETTARLEEPIDFGLVALTDQQDLSIRLVGTGDTAFDHYALSLTGVQPVPETAFDERGMARVTGLSVGAYDLKIFDRKTYREDASIETRLLLEPGRDWTYEFPVTGQRTLRVQVRGVDPTSASYFVFGQFSHPSGRPMNRNADVSPDGWATFHGPPVGTFQVGLAADVDLSTIALASGRIEESSDTTEIVLEPSKHAFVFRVVDAENAPVEGAQFFVTRKDNESSLVSQFTDVQGMCTFRMSQPGDHRGLIRHATLGSLLLPHVELVADRAEPTEILFGPSQSVEARLLDGTQPLKGVHCMLWDTQKQFGWPPTTTNESGVATWGPFNGAPFILEVNQGACWPTTASVSSGPKGSPTPIQVRRRGSLEFTLLNSQGLLVSGQPLQLTSVEFGASVLTWAKEKKVKIAQSELVSDAHGRLRIDGLPRGDFRWSLDSGAGQTVEGTATVQPATVTELTIVVP